MLIVALSACVDASVAPADTSILDTADPGCPAPAVQALTRSDTYTFDWSAVTSDDEGAPLDPTSVEGPLVLLWGRPEDPDDPAWLCDLANIGSPSVTYVDGPLDGQSSTTLELPPGDGTHLVAMLQLSTGHAPATAVGALGEQATSTTLYLSPPPINGP